MKYNADIMFHIVTRVNRVWTRLRFDIPVGPPPL